MSFVTALFIYCHFKLKLIKEKRHSKEVELFEKLMAESSHPG